MIVSRDSRLPAVAAVVALLLPLAALGATRADGPVELAQTRQQPRRLNLAPAKPGDLSVVPVQRSQLQAVSPETIGILVDSNGGLGINIWDGTRRSVVERLLPVLPSAPRSLALRDLMRRLLLTTAQPPRGQEQAGATPLNLLAARIDVLLRMGAIEDAARLAAAIGREQATTELAKARVPALLLAGQTETACRDVSRAIKETGTRFWQKALVVCQSLSGNHERAALGVDLLRDAGDEDAALFDLADAAAGRGPEELDGTGPLTPLHLALLETTGTRLSEARLKTATPLVLTATTRQAGAPMAARLEAAERAARAGALSGADLAALYRAVTFEPADLAAPVAVAEKRNDATGRALLYQAAMREAAPVVRGELLDRLWSHAAKAGRLAAAVRASEPLLSELGLRRTLAWLAPTAARALYAAGRPDLARKWFAMAAQVPASEHKTVAAVVSLWPLARIAAGDNGVPWDAAFLNRWRSSVLAAGKKRLPDILLTLLDALGDPIIGSDWAALYEEPARIERSMPPAWIWFGLRSSAERRLRGEALMFALLSLGDSPLEKVDPVVLHHVIVSLRLVGLEREARALALEAAVAHGI